MQAQICGSDGIDFFGDQHPFLVEPRGRSRKGECHHQAKQGEYRALDRTQAAPHALRLVWSAPDTNTTADFQQEQHAEEQQWSIKQRGNRRFHETCSFCDCSKDTIPRSSSVCPARRTATPPTECRSSRRS